MAPSNLLRRVGGKLTELLSSAERPAGADGAASSAHLAKDDFERRLRTLMTSAPPSQPLAGRVNFIGLSKIRDELGGRWPQVAARADEIARKAIEHRLTDVDVYTQYHELQYLIIFAQMTQEQAQLKCALIAEEIAKRLLGEDAATGLLEVKTMVSQLDGSIKFEDVPSIAALAASLAEPGGTSDGGRDDGAEKSPAHAAAGGPEKDDAWWATNHGGQDPLAAVQLVYRPMWDVKRDAVTTYVCVPAIPGPAGRLQAGESAIPLLTDPAVMNRLDLMVQRRVITDLRKLVANNQRVLLCLPVHFDTLASSVRRTEYLELCQRGIPLQGLKLLVFELIGLPAGVPQSRLLDLSATLRRFGRGMLMRTTVDQTQFGPPAETGIAGAGFENTAAGIPESRQIQDMERFAAGAKKAGLIAYVHGLQSISLTTAAVGAGFDLVDGDIVTSVVNQPRAAYRFEMSNLFAGIGTNTE